MKKYIVIALIVLVGGALLIGPFLRDDSGASNGGGGKTIITEPKVKLPAEFTFEQNLAVVCNGTQTVEVQVNQKDVASLEVLFDGNAIQKWENPTANVSFPFSASVVGTYTISLVSTLKDGSQMTDERALRVLSDIKPQEYQAQIIGNPLPHDVGSFTQGLEFHKGKLFEGVGLNGESRILEVNLQSGEILRKLGLDGTYFGEGISILNNKLYQITWQNQKCFIYDFTTRDDSFILLGDKSYKGEGWGLCNNGSELIMSNGSEQIQFIDPESFEVKRSIQVFTDEGPISQLNELEFIDGLIYANVYQTSAVVVIDPATGKVLQVIDCNDLVLRGRGGTGLELNGIAQNDVNGKIYMTGKKWPMLFEVKFVPQPLQ